MPDSSQAKQPGFDVLRRTVYIFSSNSILYSKIVIQQPQDVVYTAITDFNILVLIYKDGGIQFFNLRGIKLIDSRINTNPAQQLIVTRCCVNQNILAVLYQNGAIVYCQDLLKAIANHKLRLKSVDFTAYRQCLKNPQQMVGDIDFKAIQVNSRNFVAHLCILDLQKNETQFLFVDLKQSTNSRCFALVEITGQSIQQNSAYFDTMELHYNNSLLLLTSSTPQANITVLSLDQFNIDTISPPNTIITKNITSFSQVEACFFDVLPVYYNQLTQSTIALIPGKSGSREVDLCTNQIIALRSCEDGFMLFVDNAENQKVVEVPQSITEITDATKSDADAQKLYLSFIAFQDSQKDKTAITRSDFLLKSCGNIQQGVHNLLQAASASPNCFQAVELLKAASFAKLYANPQYQPQITEQFDKVKAQLKLRSSFLQLCQFHLSGKDFNNADLSQLCINACYAGYFDQALKIAKYAKLDVEASIKPILINKAYCKIVDQNNASISDQELFKEIESDLAKFDSQGVYRQCAEFLTKENQRAQLVSMLIEREPSLIDQVKLFLEMRQYSKAVRKAFEAFSEDLAVEALTQGLDDPETDRKALFTELLCSQQLTKQDSQTNILDINILKQQQQIDEFALFMKKVLRNRVFEEQYAGQIFQLKSNALGNDQFSLLEEICKITNDNAYQYQINLRKYANSSANGYMAHAPYLDALRDSTEMKSDQRTLVEQEMQIQQFLANSKQTISFATQEVCPMRAALQYGREAMRFALQQADKNKIQLLQTSGNAIVDDFHKFANFAQKKTDCEEWQLNVQFINGLALGITEFGKSSQNEKWAQQCGATLIEDVYKQLSSRLQARCAQGISIIIAQNVPELLRNDRIFAQTVLQNLDKQQSVKVALIVESPQLLAKSLENSGSFEMALVHQSWKSMNKGMQDAARSAVSTK